MVIGYKMEDIEEFGWGKTSIFRKIVSQEQWSMMAQKLCHWKLAQAEHCSRLLMFEYASSRKTNFKDQLGISGP